MPAYERINMNLALRVRASFAVLLVCFFVLGLRLWYLQIVQGAFFREKSENNRLRSVYIPPPRGLILDRDGVVLAKNRPSFNIELVVEDTPDPEKTIGILASIVGQDPSQLHAQLKSQRSRRPFEPKVVLKDVSRDVVAKVAARRYELPGIIVSVIPARQYVYGDFAAHVLGYIREINRNQLDSPKYAGYRMGDLVGQYGVEARWERSLQGQRGIQAVIVNATGSRIAEASYDPERAGHNLTLTVDIDVQRAADDAMKNEKGAVVAMDPNTGEILALTSAPRFDPNMFTSEISAEQWQDLTSGKEQKLNNRAVQGAYHPGSVFKIFMDVAGLAEGVIGQRETVFCPGSMTVGHRVFHCHKHSGHGSVDHFGGLVQSCDVFFYTVGTRLGVDRIHDYATRFGLGEVTGLDIGEENPGLIPSTAWKKSYYKNPEDQKWYLGETPSVSIGQGAVTVTPLQIARGVSAVVNGGKVMKPYLVKKIEAGDGSFKDDDFKPEVVGNADVEKWVLDTVRKDMEGVVNDPRGTGKRAKLNEDLGISVGGKTGTAQVASGARTRVGEALSDHAWYVGVAPIEKPQIVVAALIENGGHGGVVAAPVVKQVMEAFFYKHLKQEGTSVSNVD